MSTQTVVILGAGKLGLSVLDVLCHHANPGLTFATDLQPFRLATATRLGADHARGVVFTTNRSSAAAFREAGFVETGGVQTIRGHECHVFTKRLEP